MRLRKLEIALQRLAGFSSPRAELEQYQTPASLTARLLFDAYMKGDIEGKSVCDLGSGTGLLAIGATLLGAKIVTGVEIDQKAVAVANKNATLLNVDINFIVADVNDATLKEHIGTFDTVIMNPPFGAQNAHADRPFIDLALQIGKVTYGIFNVGSRQFIETYILGRANISQVIGGKLPIKRTFAFHTKDVQEIEVEILRLTQTKNASQAAHKKS